MRRRVSLEEIKANKQGNKICPSCGAETEEFMFKEDGEEMGAKKCKESCGWWG